MKPQKKLDIKYNVEIRSIWNSKYINNYYIYKQCKKILKKYLSTHSNQGI